MATKGRYTVYAEVKSGSCHGRVVAWDGDSERVLDNFTLDRVEGFGYNYLYSQALERSLECVRKDQVERRLEGAPTITGLEIFSPVKYFSRSLTSEDLFRSRWLSRVKDLLTNDLELDTKNIVFTIGSMNLLNRTPDRSYEDEFGDVSEMMALFSQEDSETEEVSKSSEEVLVGGAE